MSDATTKHAFTMMDEEPVKGKGQFQMVMKQLARNPAAMLGLGIFLFLVLASVFGPMITPYDYAQPDVMNAYLGPCWAHPFGTDNMGRDILSRVLMGGRYSLTIGLASTVLGSLLGMAIGAVAGFYGGTVDEVIMRIGDVIQSIPGMILNVAISCALGTGFFNCILALSIGGIIPAARMTRASILSIRKMEYVDAASIMNCPSWIIMLKHLIPNVLAPAIVGMTMGIGSNIQAAAGLAYLNLGVRPPTPEWGAMLSDGRAHLTRYPHMCLFPGLMIVITVLALNLFGDGLRDALDPKQKK